MRSKLRTQARETFATSGTRIGPRFFGGIGLTSPTDPVALVRKGYEKCVPMGGTLQGLSSAPTLTVHAMKDPDGANLDRIQIIKGWVDKNGGPQEKIIDVVWFGDRRLDANGKLPPKESVLPTELRFSARLKTGVEHETQKAMPTNLNSEKPKMNLKPILREPLVHFLVLGAALFLISDFVSDAGSDRQDRVTVTAGQIDNLVLLFQRTWQRPPTPQELQGLIEDHIQDEIFYREAVALGFDRDDTIIRRRLRQKMELFSEDLASQVEPSDQDLELYLQQNAGKFRQEAVLSFRQIYFKQEGRVDETARKVENLLRELRANPSPGHEATLGDPFLLQSEYERTRVGEVARLFGEEFGAQLLQIEPNQWAGPLSSGYGLHLVLVHERIEDRLPELVEIREVVKREWFAEHRKKSLDAAYQRLRERYTVTVETPAWARGIARVDSLGDGPAQ
ncbi:MAG: DUF3604 domain-containing protein [bacterium]